MVLAMGTKDPIYSSSPTYIVRRKRYGQFGLVFNLSDVTSELDEYVYTCRPKKQSSSIM